MKIHLLGSRRLPDGDEAIKVLKWSKPNFQKAFGVAVTTKGKEKIYKKEEFVRKFPKYAKYSGRNTMVMRTKKSHPKSFGWAKKLLPF